MFQRTDFNLFAVEDLFMAYTGLYADEHGMRKIKEIEAKVSNNKNVISLIAGTALRGIEIHTAEDYLIAVHKSSYFFFSKPETICLGVLIAMRGCIYSTNPDLAEQKIGMWHERTVEAIYKCNSWKYKTSSKKTFFNLYFDKLENLKEITIEAGMKRAEMIKSGLALDINAERLLDEEVQRILNAPVAETVLNDEKKEAERKRIVEQLFSGTMGKHIKLYRDDETE